MPRRSRRAQERAERTLAQNDSALRRGSEPVTTLALLRGARSGCGPTGRPRAAARRVLAASRRAMSTAHRPPSCSQRRPKLRCSGQRSSWSSYRRGDDAAQWLQTWCRNRPTWKCTGRRGPALRRSGRVTVDRRGRFVANVIGFLVSPPGCCLCRLRFALPSPFHCHSCWV